MLEINTEDELLAAIRKRPRMFVQRGLEYTTFRHYLHGFRVGAKLMKEPSWDWPFTDWLLKVKNFKGQRACRWDGIIPENFPTELDRFDAFFKLLEEFREAGIPNATGP